MPCSTARCCSSASGKAARSISSGALPHQSFVQLSLLPGLYAQTDGAELGHMIEFRSSAGVGYAFDNGARVSLQFDHRSNGGLSNDNPGLETFGIRLALPM